MYTAGKSTYASPAFQRPQAEFEVIIFCPSFIVRPYLPSAVAGFAIYRNIQMAEGDELYRGLENSFRAGDYVEAMTAVTNIKVGFKATCEIELTQLNLDSAVVFAKQVRRARVAPWSYWSVLHITCPDK